MNTRRLFLAALAAVAACAYSACKQPKTVSQGAQQETGLPALASTVSAADPAIESQLLSGFYGIEGNAWRWTAKDFSIALRPPAGAAQKGATLRLALTVPQPSIDKLKSLTLSASAGGAQLAPETYSQAGPFEYVREVPPGPLGGSSVKIDFHLDKAMPPANGDLRELGLIVRSAALEPR